MVKSVTLIKLGGAIITNKDIPMSLRHEVLTRLVSEIAQARKENPDMLFVVGHGSGSFAHVPASKYKTMEGFINEESVLGMAIVSDSAAQLNRIVVHEFLKADVPAVSLLPSQCLVTRSRKADSFFIEIFEEYIKHGLFPITYGDVLIDRSQGCTIWSTEEVLSFFAQKFNEKGWKVKQITHVTEADGVLNGNGQLIPELSSHNWPDVQQVITHTKGFDVTGGMGMKIQESLQLAKLGIQSNIIGGLRAGNLYNALSGHDFIGTVVQ